MCLCSMGVGERFGLGDRLGFVRACSYSRQINERVIMGQRATPPPRNACSNCLNGPQNGRRTATLPTRMHGVGPRTALSAPHAWIGKSRPLSAKYSRSLGSSPPLGSLLRERCMSSSSGTVGAAAGVVTQACAAPSSWFAGRHQTIEPPKLRLLHLMTEEMMAGGVPMGSQNDKFW